MLNLLLALAGALLILAMLQDTFEVVLLPRRIRRRVRIMRAFFAVTWGAWAALGQLALPGRRREAFLGVYGPLAMMALFGLWALGIMAGFGLLQWALARQFNPALGSLADFMLGSGDAFFTLGYNPATFHASWLHALVLLEAGVGFSFIAVTISYLPVLHQSFSLRDVQIIQLATQAGSPATSVAVLLWHIEEGDLQRFDTWLRSWERWSSDLIESHCSYPMLAFYRSQHEKHSWLASLAVVLDCCTLVLAGFEEGVFHQAESTFYAARRVLIEICAALGLNETVTRPSLTDAQFEAISVTVGGIYARWCADPATRSAIETLRATYDPLLARLSRSLLLPLPSWLPPGGITRIAAPDRRATIDRLTSTPAGSRADQESLSSFHKESSEP